MCERDTVDVIERRYAVEESAENNMTFQHDKYF